MSAKQIQDKVKAEADLEVGVELVHQVMRKDLKMGYRFAKTVPIQGNVERCLVLR